MTAFMRGHHGWWWLRSGNWTRWRARRGAHRISQCQQVIGGWPRIDELRAEPDNLPAARGAEPFSVHLTEVVRVWLSQLRQGSQNRS